MLVDDRGTDDYSQLNLEMGPPGKVKTCYEVLFVDVKNVEMVDDATSYLAASEEFKAVTKDTTQVVVVLFVCDPPKERTMTWN